MKLEQPNPDAKRMGKGMLVVAWVIVLLLLMKIFGAWEEKQYNPNQNVDSMVSDTGDKIVRLQRNRMGHYVTSGFINDVAVTLMLDTGATTVTIPEGLANRIGLSKGMPKTALTANGNVRVFSTSLEQVTIGNITLYNVEADINPSMKGDEVLLGMSALKHLDFAQQGKTLTLRQL